MIMLPIALYMSWDIDGVFLVTFIVNAVIHAFVDNVKANWLLINLITDQAVHIIQILVTFLVLMYG